MKLRTGLSRREFCQAVGVCGAGLLGCGNAISSPPDGAMAQDGAPDSAGKADSATPRDAAADGSRDASADGPADAASPDQGTTAMDSAAPDLASCVPNSVNAGPAANLQLNQPVLLSGADYSLYVGRDGNGFFAVSAYCPHQGCGVCPNGSGGFTCPCHDSRFQLRGGFISGPAGQALESLQVCVDDSGDLLVSKNSDGPAPDFC